MKIIYLPAGSDEVYRKSGRFQMEEGTAGFVPHTKDDGKPKMVSSFQRIPIISRNIAPSFTIEKNCIQE